MFRRKRILLFLLMGLLLGSWKSGDTPVDPKKQQFNSYVVHLFQALSDESLNYNMLKLGLKGYYRLIFEEKMRNSRYLTMVDFTKPSNVRRLYVVDMKEKRIVLKTYCAHGENSGKLYARHFSNTVDSHKSSLGFYLTGVTYDGKNGLSMKLHGLEEKFNSNARQRKVVLHSADYVSDAYLESHDNCMGNSEGCPVVEEEVRDKLIGLIKDKSCLFIYAPDTKYLRHSAYLKGKSYLKGYQGS